MNILPEITAESFSRLRKSHVEAVKKAINDYGEVAIFHVVSEFCGFLEKIDKNDSAQLDQVAGISAQISMAPIWTDEAISLFCSQVEKSNLPRNVVFAVACGVGLIASKKILKNLRLIESDVDVAPEIIVQSMLLDLAQVVLEGAPIPEASTLPSGRNNPLSRSQQYLWLIDQVGNEPCGAHHISVALQLSGKLDRRVLRASLDRIVERHETLRTTFKTIDGELRQVTADFGDGFILDEKDLREVGVYAQAEVVARLSAEEACKPFDLSQGPLIRGSLLQLDEEKYVLILTQHAIVADSWSVSVLLNEVYALYTAYLGGKQDPLPSLPIQYADHVIWQKSWLQANASRLQSFWKRQLSDVPALLALPTDRPRPVALSSHGEVVDVKLPAALTTCLRALSERHGTTLFAALLTGWSVLLSRLSGQDDILIGIPVANRQRAEVESLIGPFMNTLVLRMDMSAYPTVVEMLGRVKSTMLSAYEHEGMSFEEVLEVLRPEMSLSHNPLCQTMFEFDNITSSGFSLPDLKLSVTRNVSRSAKFDLSLALWSTEESIEGVLLYAMDLFEARSVARMLGSWVHLLEAMVADETKLISHLPLVSAYEREQILMLFSTEEAKYVEDGLIHSLFELQAKNNPEAIAVECAGESLSYAELNCRANHLARQLIALGVKPDDRVAICVESSLDAMVGVLGVLKSGGAYVPLDPAYPADRLAFMLNDSAPLAVVLTRSVLRSVLPLLSTTRAPPRLLDIDEIPVHKDVSNPEVPSLTSQNLAYVIYTSGTTGKPRGVMVEHRNLWASNAARIAYYSKHERFLLLSTIAFDSSVAGIFGTLTTGGCLLVPGRQAALESRFICDLIEERKVTILLCVPSLARLLFDELCKSHRPTISCLRTIIVAGEACPPDLSRLAHTYLPNAVLYNEYGPTEATVWATVHRLDVEVQGNVPIGRPIPGARVYLLDPQMQLVPVGVAGEIYIGGVGVSRGYLDRPELTLACFLSDPFVPDSYPDARMYRTGDLGRWLPDGSIEFLGRNDLQVKVRGFRIELGEIEAVLKTCAGVRDAVVVARDGVKDGDRSLVAYIVADGSSDLMPASLRQELQRELPDYMVPSAYVMMREFPVNANGKLDRLALPAPELTSMTSGIYEEPLGEVEEAIANIWCNVLHLKHIGRHDNFFELGGHSLLAVRAMASMREHFQLPLMIATLFEFPTLRELADSISTLRTVMRVAVSQYEKQRKQGSESTS